jgi:hypothetical protein
MGNPIYIDGELDSTGTTLGVVTSKSSKAYVGGWENPFGMTSKFNGLIDEVRIYNRLLSADEVRQLSIPEPTSALLLITGVGMIALHNKKRF